MSRILIAALMLSSWLSLTGCQTSKQTDNSTMIREPDRDHEFHGEVGATYGASTGRH